MNTTPTMTLERTDAAASAPRTERTPATGSFQTYEPRIEVTASLGPRYDEILTPEALAFLAELHDRFAQHAGTTCSPVRLQTRVDAANGRDPKFLPETECDPRRPVVARRRRRRRGSRTAASRSPARPTAR